MSVLTDIIDRSRTGGMRKEDLGEIVYDKNARIILDSSYKNVNFNIVYNGYHPCAFVMCDIGFLDRYSDHYPGYLYCEEEMGIRVSYTGRVDSFFPITEKKGYCFGWEYNGFDDWDTMIADEIHLMCHSKKWTVREIMEDCHKAIDRYLELWKK